MGAPESAYLDGVLHVSAPKIGVAISARNRNQRTTDTVTAWLKRLPSNAVLVIVDDASEEPIVAPRDRRVTLIRQDYQRGIAMTKNRSIAALMDLGVDHLFIADNDVFPTTDDWWKPYVESPEPHLSYQWASGTTWREIYRDPQHFAVAFPRGVMLYMERRVIESVGGMDPAYGAHGGEHVEYSTRIHKSGLTRWEYADVAGSDRIWYSHDKETGNREGSTYSLVRRRLMCDANGRLWDKRRPQFIPYREGEGSQSYDLGPSLGPSYEDCLDHVLSVCTEGTGLEFGVGKGNSLRRICSEMFTYGFDSWDGLPEDWRPGFPKGMFACEPPQLVHTHLVKGLFSDTVPLFELDDLGHITLVHLDADLYSSTKAILDNLDHTKVFTPGTFVVFDEWHGFPGAGPDDHEQRAWREFADRTGLKWSVVGHGPEQWAVRIT